MKKLIILALCLLTTLFVVTSCKPSNGAKKAYFTEYDVYTTADSTRTKITVYMGELEGHKVIYHIYDGKNKCQMEVFVEDSLTWQH